MKKQRKKKLKSYEVTVPYDTSLVYHVNATSKREAAEIVKRGAITEICSVGGRQRKVEEIAFDPDI